MGKPGTLTPLEAIGCESMAEFFREDAFPAPLYNSRYSCEPL